MPSRSVEISSLYRDFASALDLLISSYEEGILYRKNRGYRIELYEGIDSSSIERFVEEVLLDPFSETFIFDRYAEEEFDLMIEFGFRPDCLDCERETLLDFIKSSPCYSHSIRDIRCFHRIYLRNLPSIDREKILKDIVNPVIHTWRVVDGRAQRTLV